MEFAHCGEVGGEPFRVSCLKLLDEELYVGGDDFFARLWLGFGGKGATLALGVFFMVALLSLGSGFCLCRNGIAASICRTPPGEGGGSKVQGEGSPHPWRAGAAGTERAKRSGGLHKRSAEDWGSPLWRAIGAEPLSVLSTSVTKQTGDMVYSEAGWRRFLSLLAGMTMLYALERESNLGSTFAVFVELSERRDVGSGPVPRVWDLAPNGLPLDQSIQRDGAGRTRGSQSSSA
jgi:hypothetical protein